MVSYDDPHDFRQETGGILSIFGHIANFSSSCGEKDILLNSHIKGVLRNLKADHAERL